MHQQLNNANFKRDLDVTVHEVIAKDVTQEKTQDLIKVNNQVTSFKKKYSNSNQSAVNFVSFFQAQSADRFEEKDSCPTEKSIDSYSDRSSRYLSTQIELQSKTSF